MSSAPLFIEHSSSSPCVGGLSRQDKSCSVDLISLTAYVPGELLRRAIRHGSGDSVVASAVIGTDTRRTNDIAPPKPESIETCRGDPDSSDESLSVGECSQKLERQLSPGSARHHAGTCSPCAYFHKGGCSEGDDCKFCHLCPPGSIELKRKMKRKMLKASKYVS